MMRYDACEAYEGAAAKSAGAHGLTQWLLWVPALLGALFMRLYWPQCRIGRVTFAKGFALWALLGGAGYWLLDPIADAAWISDETIVAIAKALPWLTGAWMLALMALLARRAHDWGLSGAWALLAEVPIANLVLIAAALFLPGRPEGRRWPQASEL